MSRTSASFTPGPLVATTTPARGEKMQGSLQERLADVSGKC